LFRKLQYIIIFIILIYNALENNMHNEIISVVINNTTKDDEWSMVEGTLPESARADLKNVFNNLYHVLVEAGHQNVGLFIQKLNKTNEQNVNHFLLLHTLVDESSKLSPDRLQEVVDAILRLDPGAIDRRNTDGKTAYDCAREHSPKLASILADKIAQNLQPHGNRTTIDVIIVGSGSARGGGHPSYGWASQ
jgi:hypothetical protein